MVELLEFIFQDILHFGGTILLVSLLGDAIVSIIKELKAKN